MFFAAQIVVELILGFIYGFYIALSANLTGADMLDALYGDTVIGNLTMIAVIVGNMLFLFVVTVMLSTHKKSFKNEVGWHKLRGDGYLLADISGPIALGFALSALVSVISVLTYELFPFLEDAYVEFSDKTAVFTDASPALSIVATVIAAPIVEEVLFRGLIYTRLRRACSPLFSILITALLFGLSHGTVIHVLYTVPLSMILCAFYERYRSLWAPILLHFGFNVAGMAVAYFVRLPYIFIGACLALAVFGIVMLCLYRTNVKKEVWDIAMELPQKKTAPQAETEGYNV